MGDRGGRRDEAGPAGSSSHADRWNYQLKSW